MSFLLEIAPAILLFQVVAISALPVIAQGRMLLLGTAAFYTVGAFASAYLSGPGQSPHTLTFVLSGLMGGLLGAFLARICKHLRGDYFALATLCFAELIRLLLLINPPFPGPAGIPGLQRGTLLGVSLSSATAMTVAASILLLLASSTTALVIRSPWGASLQSTYDHEVAARSSGVAVDRIRLGALVYAGLWSGLAGALSVRYLSLADATTFSLPESIMVLIVGLLTGRPSVFRCLVMSFILASVSEGLRFVASGATRQIVFGALLFLLAIMSRNDLGSAESSEGQI